MPSQNFRVCVEVKNEVTMHNHFVQRRGAPLWRLLIALLGGMHTMMHLSGLCRQRRQRHDPRRHRHTPRKGKIWRGEEG